MKDEERRYEILDTIASGDFAVVLRARDRELGREVAIKQIHQQFLSDPQQLARYWQEAQLLASLQHPSILTIYDIVRSRGWLILELMRGNLLQATHGEPINLDSLRVALTGCLDALQFLHANGVIHGDVKPTNMLISPRNRIVLGDFGLARRASSEEGSLLKGTTKYMAPEMVANQFGAIGPASDLYSLGFSAYELMCGAQFESLFPGLATFGRDRQIAWMMWHAAPDRRLPEVDRVLEGVPPDLAHVVQKLVAKDQSQRYRSAAEALRDLHSGAPAPAATSPEEEEADRMAARVAAARRKRVLRLAAVLAGSFFLIVCLQLLLPKSSGPKKPPAEATTQGVITNVFPDERKVEMQPSEGGGLVDILLKPDDEFFVNDKKLSARYLQPNDKITIKFVRDDQGRTIRKQIYAARPETDQGRIVAVEADKGQFTMALDSGDEQGKEMVVTVPGDLKIALNPMPGIAAPPVQLADLKVGDRVVVRHMPGEWKRQATELTAQRVVTLEGTVVDQFDAKKNRLTVTVDGKPLDLPVTPDCEVTINDQRVLDQKILRPGDLRAGDDVVVSHDARVVRIDAQRVLGQAGVVRQVHFDAHTLDVILAQGNRPVTYLVGPQCKIALGGEPVTLDDLRDGDTVDVTHVSPDATSPEAVTIAARRPADPARWAILISNQTYDDRSLAALPYANADAALLQRALVDRYKVRPTQAELLADESLVRLEQVLPDRLSKMPPEAEVLLYFVGHAFRDAQGKVYLAPKNFDLGRIDVTGLPLAWLVDQFEKCPARLKLLLLDACQAGASADVARQPSTAEMIASLQTSPRRSPLKTVTAVASCQAGQRGLVWSDKGHGLFAWCLAEGYSGKADKDRNGRIEPTELFEFLEQAMGSAGAQLAGVQTPSLVLPDASSPRLTPQAKELLRALAFALKQPRVDLAKVELDCSEAVKQAPKEPEPGLLYGLLLLRARQLDNAVNQLTEVKGEHPDSLIAQQGIVWAQFEKRTYPAGVSQLRDLIATIPKPAKPDDRYSAAVDEIFVWAGRLREFAVAVEQDPQQLPAEALERLDAAVAARGREAVQRYQQGRDRSRAVAADFDRRIAAGEGNPAKLKIDRRQLVLYAAFPYDSIAEQIIAGLEN